MDITYDILLGTTIALYSGATIYVIKKMIQDGREKRRLKRLEQGLNFFEDDTEYSKDELTEEGRERIRQRGLVKQCSEEIGD